MHDARTVPTENAQRRWKKGPSFARSQRGMGSAFSVIMRNHRELEAAELELVHGGGLTLPPDLVPSPASPPGPPRFEDWRRSDDIEDRRDESVDESLAPHDTPSSDMPDQSDSPLAKDAGIDDIGKSPDAGGDQSANDGESGDGGDYAGGGDYADGGDVG